jgi:hypothetical protein
MKISTKLLLSCLSLWVIAAVIFFGQEGDTKIAAILPTVLGIPPYVGFFYFVTENK